MRIIVLADDKLFNELKTVLPGEKTEIIRVQLIDEFAAQIHADAYVDLLFENSSERIVLLSKLLPIPVFINSVVHTLDEIGQPFIRINAWPGFLKRNSIEAACLNDSLKQAAEKIAEVLDRKIDWVPDVPGFVSARVVSMIINEAYFALEEAVSTKGEIDTAMKLGTNYPHGPFEWSRFIGLKKIYELLSALNNTSTRYRPAELLKQEALH